MRTEIELRQQAAHAIARLKSGQCIVLDDRVLDAMLEHFGDDDVHRTLASAKNRRQLGTLDQWVCWSAESARPADLTRNDLTGFAYANPPERKS